MAFLEVDAVSGGYGRVQVLHGIDLRVDEGHVVVVLGANGAGKTTLLRAISGMLDTTAGSIRLDGRTLVSAAEQRWLSWDWLPLNPFDRLGRAIYRAWPFASGAERVARQGVAHVPQGRGTFAELTVEENLRLGANGRRDNEIGRDLARWYTVFGPLGARRRQQAGSMSGGEQQMLALARAMMARPRLLLLDEPSLGLAPLVTRELFAQLGELNRQEGMTILVVEQNANLALEIGHWGYVLEGGRVAVQGPAEQLHDDEAVRKAYLGF